MFGHIDTYMHTIMSSSNPASLEIIQHYISELISSGNVHLDHLLNNFGLIVQNCSLDTLKLILSIVKQSYQKSEEIFHWIDWSAFLNLFISLLERLQK